jgi:hypothetical protein
LKLSQLAADLKPQHNMQVIHCLVSKVWVRFQGLSLPQLSYLKELYCDKDSFLKQSSVKAPPETKQGFDALDRN